MIKIKAFSLYLDLLYILRITKLCMQRYIDASCLVKLAYKMLF